MGRWNAKPNGYNFASTYGKTFLTISIPAGSPVRPRLCLGVGPSRRAHNNCAAQRQTTYFLAVVLFKPAHGDDDYSVRWLVVGCKTILIVLIKATHFARGKRTKRALFAKRNITNKYAFSFVPFDISKAAKSWRFIPYGITSK